MNARDKEDARSLYFIHRFLPSSIAKLYGVSHVTILNLISKESITIVSDVECLLCGLEEAKTFYIDGDDENKSPQNIIMLCEADRRRIRPLQLRRRKGVVTPQF